MSEGDGRSQKTRPDYTLCLVTDDAARYQHGLLAGVEAAVRGGVTMVQYRAISGTRREQYQTACALRDLLRAHDVPLIINDHLDLVLAVGADGLHVGQNDLPVVVARRILGRSRLLGVSITAPGQLELLDPHAVDYIGVGPVFATSSKVDAAPALGLGQLKSLVERSRQPVLAIGGISLERAPAVFATGVAGIAVISALSAAPDPAVSARALRTAQHFP